MKSKKLFPLLFSLVISVTLAAQTPPVDEDGLAVGGYDVVAYFSDTAVKGRMDLTAKYDNATYRFSTKKNRDMFRENPAKYAPQFGGYCAWGIAAKGAKFSINPETYDIVDGKLYLFFNGPFNGNNFNAIEPWNEKTTELKIAAHKKWPAVKSK